MFEKSLILVIIYFGIMIYDIPILKHTNRRERILYCILIIPIIYLSLNYLLDLGWPTLDELVHFIFAKPAEQIVNFVKSPK